MSYCAAEQGSLTRRHCVHQCDECRDEEIFSEHHENCPDEAGVCAKQKDHECPARQESA